MEESPKLQNHVAKIHETAAKDWARVAIMDWREEESVVEMGVEFLLSAVRKLSELWKDIVKKIG